MVAAASMVSRPDPEPPLDSLILAPPGAAAAFAQELCSELERLGLRAMVTSVSESGGPPLPTALGHDADQVRLCVVLGIVDEKPCFALLPAPRVRGEAPRFAPQGRHGAADEVEIGPLAEDAVALAGRIAERLRR